MRSKKSGVAHPGIDITDSPVSKMYQEVIKVTFERVTIPDGTYRHKFCGSVLPEGYMIRQEGIEKHKGRTKRTGWGPETMRVSSAPCVLSAIGTIGEDGSTNRVQITFADGTATQAKQVWVDTATALNRRIAGILRDLGAICTSSDGQRLADYFRDCYMLRMQEARGRLG